MNDGRYVERDAEGIIVAVYASFQPSRAEEFVRAGDPDLEAFLGLIRAL